MNNVPYISKTKNFPYNLFSEKFGSSGSSLIQGGQKRTDVEMHSIINDR